jgi:hypothetical protein
MDFHSVSTPSSLSADLGGAGEAGRPEGIGEGPRKRRGSASLDLQEGSRNLSDLRRFIDLEACCGGRIDPVTIERFRRAIPQFHAFMKQDAAMFAPAEVGFEAEVANNGSPTEHLPAMPPYKGHAG